MIYQCFLSFCGLPFYSLDSIFYAQFFKFCSSFSRFFGYVGSLKFHMNLKRRDFRMGFFSFYKKTHFYRDCFESVDLWVVLTFYQYSLFWPMNMQCVFIDLCLLFFLSAVSCCFHCTSLLPSQSIPRYFSLFDAIANGTVFIISFSDCSCIEMQLDFVCWLSVLPLCWIHVLVLTTFLWSL